MIRVEELSKSFGEIRAVDGISFEVREGEIYGLLGPNGAGKTTTLSMLSGLLQPDNGRVLFDGVDLAREPNVVKARMGTVPQETALYEELTARENLRFWAGLYGLGGSALKRAVDAALERVGLTARADSRAREFSGGMKRRLNLALGLVHEPKVVLLDEPTVGIDPQARNNILEVVRDLVSAGTTVLYTTHYLEEAERLCDRIGIIDQGKIIAEGTLKELEQMVGGEEVVTITGSFDADRMRDRLSSIETAKILSIDADRMVLSAPVQGRGAVELLSTVLGGDLPVDGVSIQPPGLNGLFLKLTGRELELIARLSIMVRKDLLRRRRAPLGILLTLAFPVVFAGLLALTFGGGTTALPRAVLLVEDLDQSFLSGMLVSAFGSDQLAQLIEARPVGEEGRALIDEGEGSALLRIPADFGRRLLGGEPVTLELIRNPAQGILPEIVEQVLAVFADGLDAGSRLLRGPLDELQPLLEGADSPSEAQVAALAVTFQRAIEGSSKYLLPPAIELEAVDLAEPAGDEPEPGFSIFLIVLPGVSVFALFMIGDLAMRDILTETQEGTLRRQLAGPLSSRDVVNAKAVFSAVLALVSLLILSVIGAIALDRAVDLVAFVVLSAALVLAVTGFAAAVYGVARNERQGATFSSIVLLVFAFLGGSFVPIGSLPGTVQRLAPFSPFYWGVTGYGELIGNGAGLGDVLTHVLVLASLGAVLLLLGASLLDRKIRRGLAA